MKAYQNCWEFKKCGKGPEGEKTLEFGVCPAACDESSDGLNGGKNGGRICWAVSGTFCGYEITGLFAKETLSCMNCEFFNKVRLEVGPADFKILKPGQFFRETDTYNYENSI